MTKSLQQNAMEVCEYKHNKRYFLIGVQVKFFKDKHFSFL